MMNTYRLAGRTDPGRVRDNNEDAYVASPVDGTSWLLLAAIDGVGGYEGGEVAAAITARTLVDYVDGHQTDRPLELMKRALVEANNAICAEKDRKPALSEMACVASAALVDLDSKMAYVVHVGDTRIYVYGPDGLRKITHDHSLVGYLEDNGEITEFQAMHHPNRNVIDRCLGQEPREAGQDGFVESGIYPIPPEGKLLLCSDGLTDLVDARRITEILASGAATSQKVDDLVDAANEEGGKDNVTVVLLELIPDLENKKEPVAGVSSPEEKDLPPSASAGVAGGEAAPRVPRGHRAGLAVLGILLAANLAGTVAVLVRQAGIRREQRASFEQLSERLDRMERDTVQVQPPLDTLDLTDLTD